jgi:hypothetical protein
MPRATEAVMRHGLYFVLAVGIAGPASAQQAAQLPATNQSIVMTAANTFQAITVTGQAMRSLTIENNNSPQNNTPPAADTGNCWIELTGLVMPGMTLASMVTPPGRTAITAKQASILLIPSEFYRRVTLPLNVTGPIVGACDTAGDSIYVDWQ